jgi:hypothetical protein
MEWRWPGASESQAPAEKMNSSVAGRKFLECGGLTPLWFNVETGMIFLICFVEH